MLSIDWRAPAAYAHTKSLPAAGFAWEYLRRNDEYRHDFQIITLTGWAPDPSQQQPLTPGSAEARLADALDTVEIPAGEKAKPAK